MKKKLVFLGGSFLIVLIQGCVAIGLMEQAYQTRCTEHGDCPGGLYCDTRLTKTCLECSEERCYEGREDICERCTNAGELWTVVQAQRDRIEIMVTSDWLALIMAAIVIASVVFGEVRDILLCVFAIETIHERREIHHGWRFAIGLLNMLRLCGFLPFLLGAVMMLVLVRGANVLAVCLNAVAVLFLVELDNLVFSHGLGEETRAEAEEFGRVPVNADYRRRIDVIKHMCLLTIPSAICWAVSLMSVRGAYHLCPLPFMLVLFVQSVWSANENFLKSWISLPSTWREMTPVIRAACWGWLRAELGLFVFAVFYAPVRWVFYLSVEPGDPSSKISSNWLFLEEGTHMYCRRYGEDEDDYTLETKWEMIGGVPAPCWANELRNCDEPFGCAGEES